MTATQILIVIAALFAANLPFLTQRSFLGFAKRESGKPLYARLLELILLYLILGGLSAWFEAGAYGTRYPQSWEFYAITFCLFLVLAYPGFVFRYLWPRHK